MDLSKKFINNILWGGLTVSAIVTSGKIRADEKNLQVPQPSRINTIEQLSTPIDVNSYLANNHRRLQSYLSKSLAAAINDAGQPREDKRTNDLVALSINGVNRKMVWRNNNGKIEFLMSSWVNPKLADRFQGEIGKNYKLPKNRHIWLTASPQVKEFCRNCKGSGLKIPGLVMLNLRLQQYLGLPLEANKSHFVEMWVKQEDLFRPCIDKEIDDSTCQVLPKQIPANQVDLINIKQETKGYPWTGLGYTYDWGIPQKPHIGASEFVTRKGTEQNPVEVEIASLNTTKDYCNNKFLTEK